MKYILLMTVLCTGSLFSSAQSGVRFQTGINLSNITMSGGSTHEANMLSSFHAGLIADFELAPSVYLQPGLIYGGKGSKIQSGTPGTNGYVKQTFNPYYIDMPVNLVFKTPSTGAGRFFIGAGPYLSIGIRGKTKTEGQTLTTEDTQRTQRNLLRVLCVLCVTSLLCERSEALPALRSEKRKKEKEKECGPRTLSLSLSHKETLRGNGGFVNQNQLLMRKFILNVLLSALFVL